MPTVDDLIVHFKRQASLPWSRDVARDYRVWIMCYDKTLERRVQGRLHDFEAIAIAHGHGWAALNLANLVAPWFGSHELFEGLAGQPDEIAGLLPEFVAYVAGTVRTKLQAMSNTDILALSGTGSLFGLIRVSHLVEAVVPAINGRLLVLFPGRHENGSYRLLDARDGWTYRATPIPP